MRDGSIYWGLVFAVVVSIAVAFVGAAILP